jgi:ribose/xylose/arabinose/galactoside ABC-type transport system permease subunit
MKNIVTIDNRNFENIKNFLKQRAILIFLIAIIIAMSILRPDTFFTYRNLINILRQLVVLGIISCGMTMVLVGGSLDLSIGSTYSLCMVLPILLQPKGIILAITVTLLVGLLVGSINGFFVGKLSANPLIVTLGMLSVIQGIAFLITKGRNALGDTESLYSFIGKGLVLGIPFPIYILIFIALLSYFILNKTVFGRSIYLMGSNKYAAYASGINVGKIRMITFIILGLYCALGGIITSSIIDSGQPAGGKGFEFQVFTAILLGGTSLFGGIGNILNSMIGVLLLGVIGNSMIMLGLPFNLQLTMQGVILIIAVYYDVFSRGRT